MSKKIKRFRSSPSGTMREKYSASGGNSMEKKKGELFDIHPFE